jgi:hypothetical protein
MKTGRPGRAEIYPGFSYVIDEHQEETMNKRSKVAWALALFAFLFALWPALSLQSQIVRLCCVAGNYSGYQINYAKPNCPKPAKESFTMVIKQGKLCTSAVSGTITNIAGVVNNWTGTLTRGVRRGCCVLEGSFLTPSGNTVKFKGSICLKLGKWQANGTWEEIGSTDPCRGSGTWHMTQI